VPHFVALVVVRAVGQPVVTSFHPAIGQLHVLEGIIVDVVKMSLPRDILLALHVLYILIISNFSVHLPKNTKCGIHTLIPLNIICHVDPLLGNDREIRKHKRAIAKLRLRKQARFRGNKNTTMMEEKFSTPSVPRCSKQDYLENC
jgi:hypothetical protein